MLDHVDACIRVTLQECACQLCRDFMIGLMPIFLTSSLILTYNFHHDFQRLSLTSQQHGVDHAGS